VTLLPWGWAVVGSSPGRVVVGGGSRPADAFRNNRPLLALVIPGSRCQALASGDGGVDGDETPQISTSHTETAILNLPVPLGFQPGTFGGPLLAPVSTVQSMSAICKHRPLASATSPSSAIGRRRPLPSATDHPAPKIYPSHMMMGRQDPIRCAHRQSAGGGGWQLGLSYLARILDRVGRAKRRSSPRAKQVQPKIDAADQRQEQSVSRIRWR